MAIRRVTRYVSSPVWDLLLRDQDVPGFYKEPRGFTDYYPVTIEIGKEEPQVKTRERRVEGHAWRNSHSGETLFIAMPAPPSRHNCANGEPCLPAVLIVTEPVQEPTLVEAAEQYLEGMLTKSDLREALAREKQKSTR
jgi:hypothetical protein